MHLQSLSLTSFKNHKSSQYDFSEHVNCIVGKNGTGKTNLLDAIYYLAFTKSALSSIDRESISHQASQLTIYGTFSEMVVALQITNSTPKIIKVDKRELDKVSEFVGRIPMVIVLPDDTDLIKDGSELRRKFFDGALSQLDHGYLEDLMAYNRLLKQRNSHLKLNGRFTDRTLIETYDEKMVPLAIRISQGRKKMVLEFKPHLENNYRLLHLGKEVPGMHFESHVDSNFGETLRKSFDKDVVMQRTLMGSHKDDVIFSLDDSPIKKFGSQGQQKTFLISLKFALYDFLKERKMKKPLLLLDDIFDKLDDNRIQQLVTMILDRERFGQVFITDARKDRSKELLKEDNEINFIELA